MEFLISHPFNQPVANTTLWVYESFVNLEYFVWDLWCGWSGNGGGFPLSFFHLPLPITNPPVLYYLWPLWYATILTRQHIITSLVFKWWVSSLTRHMAGYRIVKYSFYIQHTQRIMTDNMTMCVMFTAYQGQAMIKIIIKVNLHHVPLLPLDNLSCLYPQQDEH
jgi:hypothetical protein